VNTTTLLLAVSLCAALAGCSQAPVDGSGAAIAKPLPSIQEHKADHKTELKNEHKAMPLPSPRLRDASQAAKVAPGPIVSPDMAAKVGTEIVAPDMIQKPQ
jgi:hypothetical protein